MGIGLRDVKRGMRLRVTVRYFNGVTGVFEGYADKDWEVIPADCHLRGPRGDGFDSDRMWIGGQEITAVELLDDEDAFTETPQAGLEAAIDRAYTAGSIFSEANRDPVDHVSIGEDEHGVYVEDQAGSPDTMAELSVTGEAMCTVRLADLQTAVAVLEAINPFQHRESERWLDRLKDEL